MSCLWLLQTFIVLFIYTDLHRLKQSPRHTHKSHHYGATSDRNFENSFPRTVARTDYDEDIYKEIGSQSQSNSPSKRTGSPTDSPYERTASQFSSPVRHSSCSSSDADSLIETAENVISNHSRFKNINSPSHNATVGAMGDGHVSIEADGLVNGSLSHEEKRSKSGSQDYIDSQEGSLHDYLQGKSKLKFIYHGKCSVETSIWQ